MMVWTGTCGRKTGFAARRSRPPRCATSGTLQTRMRQATRTCLVMQSSSCRFLRGYGGILLHAFVAYVNIEATVTDESEEGDVEVACEIDGEGGRRAYGGCDRNSRDDLFLHDFEPGAAAEKENRVVESRASFANIRADQLVDGVVAADVFAYAKQISMDIKQSCCVDRAGLRERLLRGRQRVGKCMDDRRRDARRRRHARSVHTQRIDRRLPAHAAGRRRVEVALQSLQVDRIAHIDAHDVRRSPLADRLELARDRLREEKDGGEIEVVARSPHRDRNRPVADADLQRLFDDDDVIAVRTSAAVDACDGGGRCAVGHFGDFTSSKLNVTR